MGNLTDLSNHSQGKRDTAVMAQFDGNISRNYEGVKNVRVATGLQAGTEGCTHAEPVFPEDYDAP